MKRVCKNVDISNPDFIRAAVYDCLKKPQKRERRDTRQLFARMLHVSRRKAEKLLRKQDENYHKGVELIAEMLRERIISRRLELKPIRQKRRIEPRSRKVRLISVLSIEQLMLDQIAVNGLKELSRRIGYYQVSSIKGKGASLVIRAFKRWVNKKGCKNAVGMDIRKYFESLLLLFMMPFLHKRVKNRPLLWLVGQSLGNSPSGAPVGSPLSQELGNIFLADLYHAVMENCRDKRGRRQVRHACFQMDDMHLLGRNKRQLRRAAETLIEMALERNLTVKPGWNVHKIDKQHPVDIVGYRFSQNCITIRKTTFAPLRARLLKAKRAKQKGKPTSLARSRALSSYHGYTKIACTRKFFERICAGALYQAAFTSFQHHDIHARSKIHTTHRARARRD